MHHDIISLFHPLLLIGCFRDLSFICNLQNFTVPILNVQCVERDPLKQISKKLMPSSRDPFTFTTDLY